MATPHLLSSPYKPSRRLLLQASKLQSPDWRGGLTTRRRSCASREGRRAVVPVDGEGHREAALEAHSAGARPLHLCDNLTPTARVED
jgi:hypothetical protein